MIELPLPPRFVAVSEPLPRPVEEDDEERERAVMEAQTSAYRQWITHPWSDFLAPYAMYVDIVDPDPDLFIRNMYRIRVKVTTQWMRWKITPEISQRIMATIVP